MERRLSPHEANQKITAEGYVYVDVRSAPEFAAGHPKGAVNVAFMNSQAGALVPNPTFIAEMEKRFAKDAKIIVGCQAGARSLRAMGELTKVGFTDVFDQRAGFGGAKDAFGTVVEKGWRDAGLPVE